MMLSLFRMIKMVPMSIKRVNLFKMATVDIVFTSCILYKAQVKYLICVWHCSLEFTSLFHQRVKTL